MADPATVYVIDDDLAVLETLGAMLTEAGYHVHTYSSAESFLAEDICSTPGCLLLDVRMPQIGGLELQELLHARHSPLPVIVITGHGNVDMCVAAMKLGAVDFIEKPFHPVRLLSAVKDALERTTKPTVASSCPEFEQKIKSLTPTELIVLKGIVRGQSNRQLAEMLDMSMRTVQFRRTEVKQKLGIKTRQELMNLVFRSGWNPDEGSSLGTPA